VDIPKFIDWYPTLRADFDVPKNPLLV